MNDMIDRQTVIDAVDEQIKYCDKTLASFDISLKDEYAVKVEKASLNAFRETLKYLPSTQPDRKTGRWKNRQLIYSDLTIGTCTNCGLRLAVGKYCQNCGAKMDEDD